MPGIMFTLSSEAPLATAFADALGTVKTDVMGYIGAALPVGLFIMGTILAITIGVKAFKRFAK